MLPYAHDTGDFSAFSSWLDECQSACLVRLPGLVQSPVCMSVTECSIANHCVSLSEWQLSCGDAMWQPADRRRENPHMILSWTIRYWIDSNRNSNSISNRGDSLWEVVLRSYNAHGETCLQDGYCSFFMNQRTWLQAFCQLASAQWRIWARHWIITRSRAAAP